MVMQGYQVISQPGKFEGELSIVPKMWDCVMGGCATEVYCDDTVYAFVSLADVDEPANDDLYGACLWESEQGFVHTKWYETEQEYNDGVVAKRTERISEVF